MIVLRRLLSLAGFLGCFFLTMPVFGESTYAQEFLDRNQEYHFGTQLTEQVALPSCSPGYLYGYSDIQPASLTFGETNVGTQSKVQKITFKNTDSFYVVEIVKLKINNANFVLIDPPNIPFCLRAGQTVRISVAFLPTRTGKLSGSLEIVHNNSQANYISTFIPLSGAGVAASITVNPASLNFGSLLVGAQSQKGFQIKNSGNASETIKQIKSNNAQFTVVSPGFPQILSPGGTINVTVAFQPSQAGGINGTLSVVNNANQTVAAVHASGSGVAGAPEIDVSPTTLNFGQLDVGTFKVLNLAISNSGQGPLEVQLNSPPFVKMDPDSAFMVDAGKAVQVKVEFIADGTGPLTRTLMVHSNDSNESTIPVTLMATGVAGKLGLLNRTSRSRIGKNTVRTTGVQFVDFNGDGRIDLFLTGHNGNALFRNVGNGQFSNVTGMAKLGNPGKDAHGASWADVDNDGDLDVFIANANAPAQFLRNNKGVFNKIVLGSQGTAFPSSLSRALAENTEGGVWFDMNNDGNIDLYVVKNGAPNVLLKNNGFFQFVDIAQSAHVALNAPGVSAVAADFNNDGYQDLYVVNSGRPNKLFINNRNQTFRDVTASAGVGFSGDSRNAVASDYDGDGDLDIFVVNNGGPSLLYRNQGSLKFQNVAGAAGVAGPRNGTSATFADFDNDGDEDLALMQDPGDNFMFRNLGNGRFARAANIDVNDPDPATGAASGDFNNDGQTDMVAGDSDPGAQGGDTLYQNSGGSGNNWLVLTLVGTQSNRSAIGAKALLIAGLIRQVKIVTAGNGQNQESLDLEFGLAGNTQADIVINWPSGVTQTLTGIAANQRLTVTEP